MIAAALVRQGWPKQPVSILSLAKALTRNQLKAVGFKTSTLARSGGPKTPIQEWGWAYLQRQKGLQRPLSPHLTVYKPQLTWMVSGLHRISGTVMGTAIALFVGALLFTPFDFPALIGWIRALELPRPIVYAVKWVIVWPIAFHTLNGIRFLGFDLALGIKIAQVYKTGWFVVALSMAIATVLATWKTEIEAVEMKRSLNAA